MAMVQRRGAGDLVNAAAGGMALNRIAQVLEPLYNQYARNQGRRAQPPRVRRTRRRRRQLGPPTENQAGADPYDNVGFAVTRNIRTRPMMIKASILWALHNPAAGGAGVAQYLCLGHYATTGSIASSLVQPISYSGASGAAVNQPSPLLKYADIFRLFRLKRMDVHYQTALGSTSSGTLGFGFDRNPVAGFPTSVSAIANLDVHSILPVRGSGGSITFRPLPSERDWKVVAEGTNISTADGLYGRLQVYHVNGNTAGALIGHLVIDLELEYAEPYN